MRKALSTIALIVTAALAVPSTAAAGTTPAPPYPYAAAVWPLGSATDPVPEECEGLVAEAQGFIRQLQVFVIWQDDRYVELGVHVGTLGGRIDLLRHKLRHQHHVIRRLRAELRRERAN